MIGLHWRHEGAGRWYCGDRPVANGTQLYLRGVRWVDADERLAAIATDDWFAVSIEATELGRTLYATADVHGHEFRRLIATAARDGRPHVLVTARWAKPRKAEQS